MATADEYTRDESATLGGGFDERADEAHDGESGRTRAQAQLDNEAPDTVREYLRAIGEHPLLTAPQEVELGLAVERWVLLKGLRIAAAEHIEAEPTGAELAAYIFEDLASHRDLLTVVTTVADVESDESTMRTLLADERVLELLDSPLKPETKAALAERADITEEQVALSIPAL